MIEESLIASLATALMQEGEVNLDEEAEKYADEVLKADEDEEEVGLDLQYRTEEALSCALQAFFSTLPEQTQEEIKHAIRKFKDRPDKVDLIKWQRMGGNDGNLSQ